MSNTTRQQIIAKTSQLLELQGYHGTGLNQIIRESGTPRGSLYYYFPDGKEELAAEAVIQQGRGMMEHSRLMLAAYEDPVEAIYQFILSIAEHFTSAGYCGGAPLAAVALETASTNERLRTACQQAYDYIGQPIEEKLVGGGYPAALAAQLTTLILSALEGASILSRTRQHPGPLEEVAGLLKTLLETVRPA